MNKKVQTASHWGVYDVIIDDRGTIIDASPFARDQNPSPLNKGLPELVQGDLRIDRPYVRSSFLNDRSKTRGNRGSDKFVAIGWDEALSLVEHEICRIKTIFGNESIYGGSYGWASAGRLHHSPSVLKRFLGLNGGYVNKVGNHSFGAAMHILPYVIGREDVPHLTMPWPLIEQHTQLIVMFGGAHIKNSQIESGGTVEHPTINWFRRLQRANVEMINISPAHDDVWSELCSTWLPIRPNTDVAMMLGIAHTLAKENLSNREFLSEYCEGYPRFENYLFGHDDGQPKSADWASDITLVPAEHIRELTRRMASMRTLITTSWSIQRADHGEQPIWMTVTLAAMLGQIGLPGGGFSFGFGATAGMFVPVSRNIPRPTLPLGPNAIKHQIPVGRVSDMLLNPGKEIPYNGSTIRFPDIRLVYSVGGNPFHHNSNLNRFVQAWQRPEVIVVHEPFWNPAAKFADIVLPATTTLERNDIQAAEMSRFYIAMRKAMSPFKQSRNDFDIFSELSERLGFGNAYTEGRNEMGWLRYIYESAAKQAEQYGHALPSFDQFWEEGVYEFPEPEKYTALLGKYRDNPIAHRLRTPSGKIEIFSDKIASFNYLDCPGHAVWLEPAEWLGSSKSKRFPIHLLSNQPKHRLHSQLDAANLSKNAKIKMREPLRISAKDARARGLRDGDTVRVFNDRGEFVSVVTIVDCLIEGVAQIATGAWYDPIVPGKPSLEKHGNPNVVTLDKGTSLLGQSSVAQTVLVQIEPLSEPPAVTAFVKPVY